MAKILYKKVAIIILTIILILKCNVISNQTINIHVLESNITKEDEKKEINNKNSNIQLASRGNFKGRKYRVEKLIVTAYAPFDNKSGMCNDGDPTKTATGTYPTHGTVAVNPERFPYGTKFYIPGYGYGVGEDTGGAMRKNHNKIDVFMKTYEDAIKWGIKELDVIIFDD